jgi:hypothetical protein
MSNKRFEEYNQLLDQLTDQELIDRFNHEVGPALYGWTSSKASYFAAVHHQFNKRDFDYSAIGDVHALSWKNKIRLKGKVVEISRNETDRT